ncbi:MAG: hypothetical protein JNK19_05290 [Tabrizicola sp.]|nr:hypothetical protein [Tabrizicola sp.]
MKIKDLTAGVNEAARLAQGEKRMRKTGLVLLTTLLVLSTAACAPLIVGGAAAVVADEVIEQDKGGDGLF